MTLDNRTTAEMLDDDYAELPVIRLSKDLRNAAKKLTDAEARFMVDSYYMMQEKRKRSGNQTLALASLGEPNTVLSWFYEQDLMMEKQVQLALKNYTDDHPMGEWMKSITGIGPVLSAGLLAHIDITKCPTVGHIWRFAGLDPNVTWKGGDAVFSDAKEILGAVPKEVSYEQALVLAKAFGRSVEFAEKNLVGVSLKDGSKFLARRPWNAQLKVLCWKIGQSFMKVSSNEKDVYGKLYKQRKLYEIERSESGQMNEYALSRADKVGKSTEAYKAYVVGKLPAGQLDARARRYAVKQFLSDMHAAWYYYEFGTEPPLPYPIAILGHAHHRKPDLSGVTPKGTK